MIFFCGSGLGIIKFRYSETAEKVGPSSTYNLTLFTISDVKKRLEYGSKFCGLLRISEL